ncbi:MAG: hypothetical protein R2932_19720 [Caldilineaceae bacterium]
MTIIEQLNPYNAQEVLETTILTDGYELTVGPYRFGSTDPINPEEEILEEETDVYP